MSWRVVRVSRWWVNVISVGGFRVLWVGVSGKGISMGWVVLGRDKGERGRGRERWRGSRWGWGCEGSGFDDANSGFREWGFEEREGRHTKGRGILRTESVQLNRISEPAGPVFFLDRFCFCNCCLAGSLTIWTGFWQSPTLPLFFSHFSPFSALFSHLLKNQVIMPYRNWALDLSPLELTMWRHKKRNKLWLSLEEYTLIETFGLTPWLPVTLWVLG